MIWLISTLLVLGAFFACVAALGVLRLPDFFMRMHASTKAGAFGATLILIAAALHFGTLRAALTAIFIIVFFYLTTPVAAQMLAETAYRRGVRLWAKTRMDKLAESGELEREEDSL